MIRPPAKETVKKENSFEAGKRILIPAVLVYARRPGQILFLHRHPDYPANQGSVHSGKWNGLGGKLELGESFQEGAQREFFEESGIDLPLHQFKFLGALHFPGFQAHKNQDWFVQVFEVELPEANYDSYRKSCDEGELCWVDENKVLALNLWEGDRSFIPYILKRKNFIGTLWYNELSFERAEIKEI